MELETLLTQPESKTLEFKRDLSSLAPILKTIVAFANTAGGILVIGCSSQGAVLGLSNILKEEERIANAIADAIYPSFLPEIEIATLQGKDLLIIKVVHWKGPFYLKKEGIPAGVYVRLGSTSRPAGPQLLSELNRSILSLSFDQNPLPELTEESLDFEKIAKYFNHRKVNREKLCSLGILVSHAGHFVPSIGGLVLFGKAAERHRFVPDARVNCARFLGDSKAEILDRYEVEGTILDAVESVPKFIARNTRLAASFGGMVRQDIPEYPKRAIREVLMNAFVHADYSQIGAHIQVAIFDDRLEIQSPGMLPFGFTLEDLKSGVSRVRNRVIARVFYELQLMEGWGSGYRRCIEDCEEGSYLLPEWQELGSFVRVTFYPHRQTQMVLKEEASDLDDLSDRHREILALFRPGERLAFREILKMLSGSIAERTLRSDLSQLKSRKLLMSRGLGRATVWLKVQS
jgi:ATP-dependent DNA helicase RecG